MAVRLYCPKCGGKTTLVDMVQTPEREVIRRRRCLTCDHRFHTIEYEIEWDDRLKHLWGINHRKYLESYGNAKGENHES